MTLNCYLCHGSVPIKRRQELISWRRFFWRGAGALKKQAPANQQDSREWLFDIALVSKNSYLYSVTYLATRKQQEMMEQSSFSGDSDETLLDRALNLSDYDSKSQERIMAEVRKRPGLTEQLEALKESHEEMERAYEESLASDRVSGRERFPAFVCGVAISTLIPSIGLVGGDLPAHGVLHAAAIFLIAIPFLSGFNTSLEFLSKGRTTLLISLVVLILVIMNIAVPRLRFASDLSDIALWIVVTFLLYLYFYFFGWLGSKLLVKLVPRGGKLGSFIVSLWREDKHRETQSAKGSRASDAFAKRKLPGWKGWVCDCGELNLAMATVCRQCQNPKPENSDCSE